MIKPPYQSPKVTPHKLPHKLPYGLPHSTSLKFASALVGVLTLFLGVTLISRAGLAKDITSNEVKMTDAPQWLTQTRVEKVTDHIQDKLEWSTRRTQVIWYSSQEAFEKVHGLGPMASAVTKSVNGVSTVYLGPTIDNANFDEIFGHEMVHVIIAQKYGDSIPKWLEEGLANHYGKRGTVDYKWLAKQPFPKDVHELAHPFNGTAAGIGYRYKASQALAEMLDKKCNLQDLIRLSVKRHLEDYISNTCEIKDLNQAFRDWVKKKSS